MFQVEFVESVEAGGMEMELDNLIFETLEVWAVTRCSC